MAEEVPSQGRFIGVLALVLMGFAILAALVVLGASLSTPAVM